MVVGGRPLRGEWFPHSLLRAAPLDQIFENLGLAHIHNVGGPGDAGFETLKSLLVGGSISAAIQAKTPIASMWRGEK